MELPRRARGDELLKPGELTAIRARLRSVAAAHDLTTVIACAFDHRTRMLPFIYADTRMAPAGVRSIGSTMVDAGFDKTRIVLQQWNRHFRPSKMRVDGRVPDLFMVSSMGLHSDQCMALVRDARRIGAELIDTGVQRLVGDLDELPDSVLGDRLLEPPSRRGQTLGSRAVEAGRVRRLSPISSIVLTFGCKFACQYCPIPAYNQRQHRVKSGGRIAEEMHRLNSEYGLKYFFGADDNFFNTKSRTLEIVETLARADFGGQPLRKRVRWHTEVTVHDTLQMRDHLPLIRTSGCRALWLGVEDLTATLVNKGQSEAKTVEAFRLLSDNGICPMPMMMHHDTQPLYSRGTNYGLLNQIRVLRKAGAVSLQVLMMTPSAGTKLYEGTFTDGLVLARVGGREVRPHMYDGNYVVASKHARPWRKQLNLLLGYLYFYNPVWLAVLLIRKRTHTSQKAAAMQLVGMLGLTQTIRRTALWTLRLMFGKVQRLAGAPASPLPMRGVDGGAATHAACGTTPEPLLTLRLPKRQRAEAAVPAGTP